MKIPSDEIVVDEFDAERRLREVEEGVDVAERKLDGYGNGNVPSADQAVLMTLVLSLHESLREAENVLDSAATRNGNGNGEGFAHAETTELPILVLEDEHASSLNDLADELRERLDRCADELVAISHGRERGRAGTIRNRVAAATPVMPLPDVGVRQASTVVEPVVVPPTMLAPAPVEEAPASRRRVRFSIESVARLLTAVGLVIALFVGFELWVSGLTQARSQRVLLAQFEQDLVTHQLDTLAAPAVPGNAVALLEIPKLGVQQVVVEGTTPEDLQSGPGHVADTPLPGEFGHSVIAGRRVTYGAPFKNIGELAPGDPIEVTTGQGQFTYDVTRVLHVTPGQPEVLAPTLDSELTLLTSDPAFVATGRLAVVAKLQGNPLGIAKRPTVSVGSNQLGLQGDASGLVMFLVWTPLLVLALWGARRLYRRMPARATYLLTTPVILMLLWLVFENLSRVLPGTQ